MRNRHLHRIISALIVVAAFFSCNDNTAELDLIREQLQEHEREIQALKLAVERLNQDISSLRSVLSELRSGGYVASVTEETRDNEVVGYTLSFSDGRGVYLRTMASSLNTNLASLQVIVATLQDGDYLMSVSPFMEYGLRRTQ